MRLCVLTVLPVSNPPRFVTKRKIVKTDLMNLMRLVKVRKYSYFDILDLLELYCQG